MYLHLTVSDIFRFWSKVDKDGPNGCWLWTGNLGVKGHGQFRHTLYRGKHTTHNAQRIAWIISRGQLDSQDCVLHNCPGGDNSTCVNPDHMFIGTRADNTRDMYRKGRNVNVYGSAHGSSHLDEKDVREIRARYAQGGITQRQLATQYNVAQQTVSRALTRNCWAHLDA